MFGILELPEMDALLHEQIIGRIGCHAAGVTYIVPISYAYDGKDIYAHTLEGMKTDLMRKNTNVCFEVDSLQATGRWQSVICWGSYEEISETGERMDALKLLHAKGLPRAASLTARILPEWPFLPRDISDVEGVLFRIKLYKKTGKFENS